MREKMKSTHKKEQKRLILPLLFFLIFVFCAVFWLIRPSNSNISSDKKLVLAIGDSITYGYATAESRQKDSYPAQLAEKLGEQFEVRNLGQNGRTLLSTSSLPYFANSIGQRALNTNAKIIIFMLGTNDARKILWDAERFEREYIEVIDQFLDQSPVPQLILMMPPPAFTSSPNQESINNVIIKTELKTIIELIAEEKNLPLIDLYTLLENKAHLFPDGIHPNAEGNRLIANAIYEAIQKLKINTD